MNVPDVVVIMWNGKINSAEEDVDDLLTTAQQVRQQGVRLLMFGVGTDVDQFSQTWIASHPTSTTIFDVLLTANLTDDFRDSIVAATCNGIIYSYIGICASNCFVKF